jgi:hypothetical protein
MKKIFGVLVVLVSVLAFMGCASSPASAPGNDLPDFVRNPGKYKIEGAFVGIGSAKFSTANMTMTMAETRARAAIARKISSTLKNMIDDYNAEVEGDPAAAEQFSQVVTRALSQANLSDTEVEMADYGADGTYYVLMSMPKRSAIAPANTAIDREKLQYAKFQNWNAQRDMQAAFAAENGDPEIVSTDEE